MSPEILSQLKDVHLPPSPSWWPLAIGYYVAAALLLLCLAGAVVFYRQRQPKWALKKEINKELRLLEQSFLRSCDAQVLQNGLGALLRRVLIILNPQTKNMSMSELARHLDKHWGSGPETGEFISLLEQDRFKKVSALDGSRLITLANKKFKQWKL